MNRRFYVYRIYDLGGTVYIGKGSGRRLAQQIKNFGCFGEVVKSKLTEREAYEHERRLIRQLKPIRNRCAGGGGPRSKAVHVRRAKWEIDIERVGTRVYAARELLKFDLRPFLAASKIDRIRQVAYGSGP